MPSPMKSSNIHGAKPGPACGRAETGMLLIETSTAGKSRSAGSSTARPVSGLMPSGKSSSSGPYRMGDPRGWGVDVGDGIGVKVVIVVGTCVAMRVAVAWILCGLLQAVKRKRKMIISFCFVLNFIIHHSSFSLSPILQSLITNYIALRLRAPPSAHIVPTFFGSASVLLRPQRLIELQ